MKPVVFDKGKISADWSPYRSRPTWSCVSSAELADALGVCLQSISNWKIRQILPAPLSRSKHLPKGNKNFYRIGAIRSWLENKPEEDIHWQWIHEMLGPHLDDNMDTLPSVAYYISTVPECFGVERSIIPAYFGEYFKPWTASNGRRYFCKTDPSSPDFAAPPSLT